MVVGRNHGDENLRYVVQPRHIIVVEVRLLDRAVLDGDALRKRKSQSIDDTAFRLRHDVVGLHRDAGIECHKDFRDQHLAGLAVDDGLRNQSDLRPGIVHVGEAERAAVPLCASVRHAAHRIDDIQRAGIGLDQVAAEPCRIDAALAGKFVHERLDGEDVGQVRDAAQARSAQAAFAGHRFSEAVGDIIIGGVNAVAPPVRSGAKSG